MADDSVTEDKPKQLLGLSGIQTIGSAMAAVTSALVGSFLGVAGTLLGAALGSIVATVGAALYSRTLRSAADVAKVKIPVRRRRGVAADNGGGTKDNTRETLAASAPSVAAAPRPPRAGKKLTPKAWIKIASVSVGAFAIAMVGITAVEYGSNQPISSLVSSTTDIDSGTTEKKTTLGRVLGGNQSTSDEADESTKPAEVVPKQVEEVTNVDGLDTDGTPGGGDSGSAEVVEPGTGESSETVPADPAPETEQAPAPAPEADPIPEPEVVSDPGTAEQDGPAGADGAVGTSQ
jgi:hypothetical protein